MRFAYDPDRPILHDDISFEIPAGQTAVVGPIWLGQSTLAACCIAFYDVQAAIRVEGQDIRQLTQDSLRRHIGIVRKTPCCSTTPWPTTRLTVALDATNPKWEAAARPHAFTTSSSAPQGYDTVVGERA